MLINVVLVQHRAGQEVGLDLKLHLLRKRPDFVCFPEYWAAGSEGETFDTLLARQSKLDLQMQRLSETLSCVVVGGTRLIRERGKLYNASPVFDSGKLLGQYRKAHPTAREKERGVASGSGPGIWQVGALTMGVAICNDSLQAGYFRQYGIRGVDLLLVPNASPLRPGESTEEKFRRDQEIFVQGARDAGAYVVKVCSVGSIFGAPLQGRSLVAAPWDVLYRVPPDLEDRPQVISVTLSLSELREFRATLARRAVS